MKKKNHLVDISNVVYHTKHPIFYLLKYFPKYPGAKVVNNWNQDIAQ